MTDAPDLQVVTQIQQQVWSRGTSPRSGPRRRSFRRSFARRSMSYPDGAYSTSPAEGNGAIAAARRNATAVGLDYVPALLERGRERAAAEGYEIEFVEGDAQDLPFEDASFDYVISDLRGDVRAGPGEDGGGAAAGVPLRGQDRHGQLAAPRARGRRDVQGHRRACAAAPGIQPAVLWGTEDRLRELFGDGVSELTLEPSGTGTSGTARRSSGSSSSGTSSAR